MLDVIIPCYNEEKTVKEFYKSACEELKGIKFNLIFVDDGSNDNTLKELKSIYESDKDKVKIISFSRNFGKESALYAGLCHSKSEYCSIIDADMEQHPKYLVEMITYLKDNKDYDIVCMCQKQNKNRFFQKCFYKIMDKATDIHIENGASDFRLFRNNVVKSIVKMCEKTRFSKGLFSYIGYNTKYMEYEVGQRIGGESKWGFKKLLNYAINGIVSFSSKPLRFVNYCGIISIFASFIYLIISLCVVNPCEYASLIIIILLMSGLILIGIGISGEYIGKIYIESKNRPIYIAKERVGFDEDIL